MKTKLNGMLVFFSLLLCAGANAQKWEWTTGFGGLTNPSEVQSHAVAVDGSGNSYIIGEVMGDTQFDNTIISPAPNTLQPYIAKYNSSGTLQWVTYIKITGLVATGIGTGIALGNNGEVFVTGYFSGVANFGGTAGSMQTFTSATDGFIARYNSNGRAVWAVQLGRVAPIGGVQNVVKPMAIDVDQNNVCYVTGGYSGTAMFKQNQLTTHPGDTDIFMHRYSEDAAFPDWAIQARSDHMDYGLSISVDDIGNCFVAGFYTTRANFGPFILPSNNDMALDFFALKLKASSGAFEWVRNAYTATVGINASVATGIVKDDNGGCYVTGFFVGTANFGALNAPVMLVSDGSANFIYQVDVFVIHYDTNSINTFVLREGGKGPEQATGICYNEKAGSVFVSGFFRETAKFNNGAWIAVNPTAMTNCFVVEYKTTGEFKFVTRSTGVNDSRTAAIATNGLPKNRVYVTGTNPSAKDMLFNHSFLGNTGVNLPNVGHGQNGFLAKLNPIPMSTARQTGPSGDDLAEGFRIYPNPAAGHAILDIDALWAKQVLEIRLLSLSGKEIMNIKHDGAQSITLDVTGIADGTYIVMLKSNDKTATRQLLVRN